MKMPVDVVAALVVEDGRFLICRRPVGKARAGLWEFAGGKVEPGETPQAALIRECQEELDVTLRVDDVYFEVVHAYPDITVRLTLFRATIASGTLTKKEHDELRWITPPEIRNFAFCPADEAILEKIVKVGF